jgi:hypothetical protein
MKTISEIIEDIHQKDFEFLRLFFREDGTKMETYLEPFTLNSFLEIKNKNSNNDENLEVDDSRHAGLIDPHINGVVNAKETKDDPPPKSIADIIFPSTTSTTSATSSPSTTSNSISGINLSDLKVKFVSDENPDGHGTIAPFSDVKDALKSAVNETWEKRLQIRDDFVNKHRLEENLQHVKSEGSGLLDKWKNSLNNIRL